MTFPTPYQNVLITYKRPDIVTRRVFYTPSDGYYDRSDNWIDTPNGYYQVPQYWFIFTPISGKYISLGPEGMYSYGRVLPNDIDDWIYCQRSIDIANGNI